DGDRPWRPEPGRSTRPVRGARPGDLPCECGDDAGAVDLADRMIAPVGDVKGAIPACCDPVRIIETGRIEVAIGKAESCYIHGARVEAPPQRARRSRGDGPPGERDLEDRFVLIVAGDPEFGGFLARRSRCEGDLQLR